MKPFIIAEIGNNHEGSPDTALELLYQAIESGVDAVKFQAGTAEGFARRPEDIKLYEKFVLPVGNFYRLWEEGNKLGVPVFFSISLLSIEVRPCIENLPIVNDAAAVP